MNKKIKIVLISIVFILFIGISNMSFAISSLGGYTIDAYDINMNVNENNTIDITEKIKVRYLQSGLHGIYRKIPLNNKITRTDGTTATKTIGISNIEVDDNFTISNESGCKVIKIGNSNKTVSGTKQYTISYQVNIGNDTLKDADELYYNIIGNEWDVGISNVTFTIKMPKAFEKSSLGFSSGVNGSTDSSKVNFQVDGNIIKGKTTESLLRGEAVTVRLTLPEGYFVGTQDEIDLLPIISIIVAIVFVIIAFILWNKFGKDDIVVDTVEFYPPEGLNSLDVGFINKGYANDTDIISLLIYLANKGYLKIEEYEEKGKVFKKKSFKIIKEKEYDGTNEEERIFFEGLFKTTEIRNLRDVKKENHIQETDEMHGDAEYVTKDELYNTFYLCINIIKMLKNKKENQKEIFEESSFGKKIIIVGMIIIIMILMGCFSLIPGGIKPGVWAIILMFYILPMILLYKFPDKKTIIATSFIYGGTIIFSVLTQVYRAGGQLNVLSIVQMIVGVVSVVSLIIFLGIMKKRSKYGNEMLGRIRGFKKFLEEAEKPKLEELVMENPEYFYNILPYTYVLGVSKKWMNKFEDIALEAPSWYVGYYSYSSFNHFMNSTYSSISETMQSSPSSSGGSSGGGSSGGGFGRWWRWILVDSLDILKEY